jgi:hypothetical protein
MFRLADVVGAADVTEGVDTGFGVTEVEFLVLLEFAVGGRGCLFDFDDGFAAAGNFAAFGNQEDDCCA